MKKTLEQFKSMSKKNKIILVSILAGIILIFGATTYAFFSVAINGESQPLSVQTGTLILEFNDAKDSGVRDEEIALDNEITKEMVIINQGTQDATATIMWNELTNTYLDRSLKYTIKQTVEYNNDVVINTDTLEYNVEVPEAGIYVPRSEEPTKKALTRGLVIPAGKKIYYRVTITYNHLDDVDQTSDLEAYLSTSFTLEEGEQLEVFTIIAENRNLIGYKGVENEELVIPATYEDENGAIYKVELGTSAFYNCDNLKSMTISDGVTNIGNSAFSYCSNLTSITIPDSVTSIENFAFASCSNLTTINVDGNNNSYKSIDGVLFTKDGKILVQCPGGKIGDYSIPYKVKSIGVDAFYDCNKLTSVTIPDSVNSIGIEPFSYCKNLASINVNEENQTYKSIDGVLYTKDGKCLVQYPRGNLNSSYTIPESVANIGDSAFYCCKNLTSITIPDSVTSIGNYAFDCCKRLTSITIPDNVQAIGEDAFSSCIRLASVIIGNGITSIGYETFYGCRKLTSITISDSVTSIGDYAFYNCEGLTSIIIPDGVTKIGYETFSGCINLTSIAIPNSVINIGENAFYDVPWFNEYIKAYVGNYVTIGNNILVAYKGTETKIIIPDNITSIGARVFINCGSLTSITIPNSVTNIGNRAFYGCSSLTSITIPNSVTSIGSHAFYSCGKLSSVVYKGTTYTSKSAFTTAFTSTSGNTIDFWALDYTNLTA